MYISHITLKNWRNFRSVDENLKERMFFVGPNASGKSNLLEVFRFLHDIAKRHGGGLQQAVKDRGGISKIRCLATRRDPDIIIGVEISEFVATQPKWKYEISISQKQRGDRLPFLKYEKVWKEGALILDRPDEVDKKDPERLTETSLEQLNANELFREVADFLQSISYLHIVPQLIRHPEITRGDKVGEDCFGVNFLAKISETPENIRRARLRKIQQALSIAVPQLEELEQIRDKRGIPHLQAKYKHWRPKGTRQQEAQFSDGTLRLIGFLWSLLENDTLLLLEEPELSLNSAIIRRLPALMYRISKGKKRQIFITTHSSDLLSDTGIAPEEVFLLIPSPDGTEVKVASEDAEIRALVEGGMPINEIVIPKTSPQNMEQLELFP